MWYILATGVILIKIKCCKLGNPNTQDVIPVKVKVNPPYNKKKCKIGKEIDFDLLGTASEKS